MKLRHALAAVPLVVLVACGGSDNQVFTISTGNYALSSVVGVPTDECNLASTFPDNTVILVTVADGSATLSLGSTPNPQRNPVSTISGNTIAEGAKTYTSNDIVATCTENITVAVSGEILANDQFNGTLKYTSATPVSGSTGCTPSALGYKSFPCASTMTFQAKKQ